MSVSIVLIVAVLAAMVEKEPQVDDRVLMDSDPRVVRRQLCQTSGALSAWYLQPSVATLPVVDWVGAFALAAVVPVGTPAVVFVVTFAAVLLMVEMVNRVRVPDPDGLVAKANTLVALALAALAALK